MHSLYSLRTSEESPPCIVQAGRYNYEEKRGHFDCSLTQHNCIKICHGNKTRQVLKFKLISFCGLYDDFHRPCMRFVRSRTTARIISTEPKSKMSVLEKLPLSLCISEGNGECYRAKEVFETTKLSTHCETTIDLRTPRWENSWRKTNGKPANRWRAVGDMVCTSLRLVVVAEPCAPKLTHFESRLIMIRFTTILSCEISVKSSWLEYDLMSQLIAAQELEEQVIFSRPGA